MKFEPSQSRLTQVFIVSLLLLLGSGVVLGFALSRGVRSNDWFSTPAVIANKTVGLNNRGGRVRLRWRTVEVNYTFDGREFQRKVSLFSDLAGVKKGTNLTVYVNPNRPTELAAEKGFVACDYAIPMSCTLASLACVIVLLCIMYSPADDCDSEVNEGLM